jgi:hypothetical protein
MIEDYFEGNPSINVCIYECFQHLDARDVTAFKRKLKSYSRLADKGDFFHTFRELIVGSYLARNNLLARSGQRVQWQKKYGTLTPDWSILGRPSEPAGLVEVMNFHADRQTEIYVRTALDAGRIACFPYDEVKTEQRLRSDIIDKCKYKELTESLDVPYTIACFCFLDNPVETRVVRRVLYSTESGLFRNSGDGIYPHVSGLVLFGELARYVPLDSVEMVYKFQYFPNPYALRMFTFPVGDYYPPMSLSNRERHLLFMRFAKGEITEEQFHVLLDELGRGSRNQ